MEKSIGGFDVSLLPGKAMMMRARVTLPWACGAAQVASCIWLNTAHSHIYRKLKDKIFLPFVGAFVLTLLRSTAAL